MTSDKILADSCNYLEHCDGDMSLLLLFSCNSVIFVCKFTFTRRLEAEILFSLLEITFKKLKNPPMNNTFFKEVLIKKIPPSWDKRLRVVVAFNFYFKQCILLCGRGLDPSFTF